MSRKHLSFWIQVPITWLDREKSSYEQICSSKWRSGSRNVVILTKFCHWLCHKWSTWQVLRHSLTKIWTKLWDLHFSGGGGGGCTYGLVRFHRGMHRHVNFLSMEGQNHVCIIFSVNSTWALYRVHRAWHTSCLCPALVSIVVDFLDVLCTHMYQFLNIWYFFNSLWPRDAIWQHRSGNTLAQVMTWCRQATSHYLNQCWHIIKDVLWY